MAGRSRLPGLNHKGAAMGEIALLRQGPVCSLTLSNPRKANALDFNMLSQLDEAIDRVQSDADIRVLVLRGTPGGTFSSGADVADWAPLSPEEFGRDWLTYGNRIFRRFEALRCPTLAVIEGLCFGGGLELALCADLRLATPAAKFRFPEIGIGAIPGWEGGNRLARLVGLGRAMQAVLTTQTLDSSTAERWGLVNEVCDSVVLDLRLSNWVDGLCTVSPRAACLAKQGLRMAGDTLDFYEKAGVDIKSSSDSRIGLEAFFQKTQPIFR
jgi:enoyl-CoA hydratase